MVCAGHHSNSAIYQDSYHASRTQLRIPGLSGSRSGSSARDEAEAAWGLLWLLGFFRRTARDRYQCHPVSMSSSHVQLSPSEIFLGRRSATRWKPGSLQEHVECALIESDPILHSRRHCTVTEVACRSAAARGELEHVGTGFARDNHTQTINWSATALSRSIGRISSPAQAPDPPRTLSAAVMPRSKLA
jgi:hypothetical protein